MQIIGVTNNLNFALGANRLKMMTKTKTSAIKRIKLMWALPALALLLFAFSEPAYQLKPENGITEDSGILTQKSEKELTISGKVIRQDNREPIPGASVIVKGTSLGTVSDTDGSFSLVIPNANKENDGSLSSEIVVSFVGMQTAVMKVGASGAAVEKGRYTIKLEDAVQVLYNKTYTGEQLVPPPPPPPPAQKTEKSVKSKVDEMAPPPPPPPPATGEGEKVVFMIVEDMPKYPGGSDALQEFIMKMQQKIAQSKGVKGKATLSFTVNSKGKVTDIKVVESDNDEAAKGAVVLASEMPDWTPGKQRGKAVPVKYLLPVEFK